MQRWRVPIAAQSFRWLKKVTEKSSLRPKGYWFLMAWIRTKFSSVHSKGISALVWSVSLWTKTPAERLGITGLRAVWQTRRNIFWFLNTTNMIYVRYCYISVYFSINEFGRANHRNCHYCGGCGGAFFVRHRLPFYPKNPNLGTTNTFLLLVQPPFPQIRATKPSLQPQRSREQVFRPEWKKCVTQLTLIWKAQ